MREARRESPPKVFRQITTRFGIFIFFYTRPAALLHVEFRDSFSEQIGTTERK